MAYLDLSLFTKYNTSYTITSNGDASIVTLTASPFSLGSLALDGNGDYLSVPDNNDWNRTGSFTIDFWVYITAHDTDISAFCGQGGNATSSRWRLRYYNGNLEYDAYSVGTQNVLMQRAWSPSLDTWYHVALVKNVNDYYMFIDGTQIGTTYTDSDAPGNISATLDIGRCFDAGGYKYLNGYMNEFRWSNVARWTPQTGQDFTPSTTLYTSNINTLLLLHLTEDTKDYSHDFFVISGTNNEKITFTTYPLTDDSYLYKDYGASYFGNFEFIFDLRMTAQESASSEVVIFKLANTLATNYSNGHCIWTDAQTDTSKYKLNITSNGGNTLASTNTYDVNTTYYIRALRTDAWFGIEIYGSISDRTNKINRLEKLTFVEGNVGYSTAWRYYEAITSRGNTGGGVYTSGYIENIELVYANRDFGTLVHDSINGRLGDTVYIDNDSDIHLSGHRYLATGIIYYQVSTDGGNNFTDGEGGSSGSVKSWTLPAGSYPENSAIVVDSEKNIYLFYHRRYDIFMRKKTAGTAPTWGAEVNITNDGNYIIYSLRAEIDANDNIIVVGSGYYSGRTDGLIAVSSDDKGATWVVEFDHYDDANTFSDLTIDQNNDAWCVHFTDYGGWDAEVHKADRSVVTGGYSWNWLGAYNNRTGVTVYGSAIIAERDTNNVWEFLSILDGSYYKIQYSKYNGSTWSAWTTIVQKSTSDSQRYYNLSVIRNYDNHIYLTYNLYDGTNHAPGIYLLYYDTSNWNTPYIIQEDGIRCSLQQPNLGASSSKLFYVYEHYLNISGFVNELNVNQIISSATVTLEEEINLKLSLEIEENIALSEVQTFTREVFINENIILTDAVETNVSLEKVEPTDGATLSDSVLVVFSILKDIDSDFRMIIGERKDIFSRINSAILTINNLLNKINSVKLELVHFLQKFNSVYLQVFNTVNAFHSVYGIRLFLLNQFNMIGLIKSDINNDFRIKFRWQKAGLVGPQSLGKEYIKVYFNNGETGDIDVEQTDVDIDSISINKSINTTHTASFNLARPYDTLHPGLETIVKIKYNNYLLYKGYIVSINPTDSPEHINIECRDKYWLRNREKAWVYVGHILTKPTTPTFLTPHDYLTDFGIPNDFEGGQFIPQGIDCMDTGESDAVTEFITSSGNYGWYYDVDDSKKIWRGGAGPIANLEKQEIGKNINLYQVINNQITESCENIINKLRVELGTVTRVIPGRQGETREYKQHWYSTQRISAIPDWDSGLEINASKGGYGFNYHQPNQGYGDVFKKYRFTTTHYEPSIQGGWTDIIPPYVVIESGFGTAISIPSGKLGQLKEGYSVDWDEGTLTLNEPFYFYDIQNGKITKRRAPNITMILTKEKWITRTETIHDRPSTEITSQLGFITAKMGDYPKEVLGILSLPGLSNQSEYTYASRATSFGTQSGSSISYITVPGWQDSPFANDYAHWQLSKTCQPTINGTITLTLDAILFYGIDLSKRVMITRILPQPLNIMSMDYNLSNFTVTLNVERWYYFKRSISYVSHGEGITISAVRIGQS